MKVLISAFKPFNNEMINPSLEIANQIINEKLFNDIKLVVLDVLYNKDSLVLLNCIKEYNPDVILLLGQAGGRSKVCVEQFALNLKSANIADNNGVLVNNEVISDSGNQAYKSTIDLSKLVESLNDNNLTISNHAGTFICNEIYYNALKYIDDSKANSKCVFIHIPFVLSQVENKGNIAYLDQNISKDIIVNIIK